MLERVDQLKPPRRDRLTMLGLAFALGIVIGQYQPQPLIWPWLVGALFFLGFAIAAPPRLRTIAPLLAVCAIMFLGAAWYPIRNEHLAADDLAAQLGEQSGIVRIVGVAEGAPELVRRTNASLAQFSYRTPSTYFPVRVSGVEHASGHMQPAQGRLLIGVSEPVSHFRAGDRVEAAGYFHPFESPRNPGELDRREFAKALGQAGWLSLPSRELLIVERDVERSWLATARNWIGKLRHRAAGYLLADLPSGASANREALLKALLLGQREPDLAELDETFQRLGISHLLAISGLHLGILAGMFVLVLRFFGGERPWHGWLLILVVLAYLMLVEVRVPVLRGGIMTIAFFAGFTFRRRLSASGLVSLSGILLLLWRPDQIFWPGFQLSFGVVLGLLHLSPVVRVRWFGLPNAEASSAWDLTVDWAKSAFAVATTAWFIATPIIAYHFGIVSPWGIPLAVVGVPAIAVLLAIGYAKILLGLLLPSVGLLLGIVLAIIADALISIVIALDSLPGVALHVPFPSAWWTLVTLGFMWAWLARPERFPRTAWHLGLLALLLWLYAPSLFAPKPALRVDMISVGHGACFVLRSGDETFVFDAGSISQFDAGKRWIIPTLRRLGVHSVDTIAISHPHIDHYAGVLELVDAFALERVLVTHQFIEHGREHPDTAVAFVHDELIRRRLPPRPAIAGRTETLGSARLTWLHPPEDLTEFGRDNEHSMVILVEVADRRILLTGDVERAGLAALLSRNPDLRTDVLEMPHHGAWHDLTAALVEQVQPSIILQSSGRAQWDRDRWQPTLDTFGIERLVTHRDGASWIEIDHDGTIRSGSFRNDPGQKNRR